MTKLEVMKINKKMYVEYSKKIENMNGLEKVVAQRLVLSWIKGNKWMGGLSDSQYQRISDELVANGYDEMKIYDEYNKQIENFM